MNCLKFILFIHEDFGSCLIRVNYDQYDSWLKIITISFLFFSNKASNS